MCVVEDPGSCPEGGPKVFDWTGPCVPVPVHKWVESGASPNSHTVERVSVLDFEKENVYVFPGQLIFPL